MFSSLQQHTIITSPTTSQKKNEYSRTVYQTRDKMSGIIWMNGRTNGKIKIIKPHREFQNQRSINIIIYDKCDDQISRPIKSY